MIKFILVLSAVVVATPAFADISVADLRKCASVTDGVEDHVYMNSKNTEHYIFNSNSVFKISLSKKSENFSVGAPMLKPGCFPTTGYGDIPEGRVVRPTHGKYVDDGGTTLNCPAAGSVTKLSGAGLNSAFGAVMDLYSKEFEALLQVDFHEPESVNESKGSASVFINAFRECGKIEGLTGPARDRYDQMAKSAAKIQALYKLSRAPGTGHSSARSGTARGRN